MGSHQLITVPDYNWITITSNNLKGVIWSNYVIEQNGGHVAKPKVSACLTKNCLFQFQFII